MRILEKQAEFRTAEDLETIADLMEGLQSFRKYSRPMQLSMCRIVRYMKLVLTRVGTDHPEGGGGVRGGLNRIGLLN